jgi:hypothetical protein
MEFSRFSQEEEDEPQRTVRIAGLNFLELDEMIEKDQMDLDDG